MVVGAKQQMVGNRAYVHTNRVCSTACVQIFKYDCDNCIRHIYSKALFVLYFKEELIEHGRQRVFRYFSMSVMALLAGYTAKLISCSPVQ